LYGGSLFLEERPLGRVLRTTYMCELLRTP
jgi:hypothetical protein